MGMPPLRYEKDDDGIAWLTLDRPEVLNALNLAMRDALWSALEAVRDDPEVRVAVLRGAGERAFSAGADISEFGTAPSFVESRRARHDRDVWALMLSMLKPLVASVHGFAYGAGCEMALLCDIRIASANAMFALPEVALGYIPSAGGTQTLPRIVRGVAREMILSGESIDAARALEIGLVHKVVPHDKLDDETLIVARRLAAQPARALAAAKDAMRRGAGLPLGEALLLEQLVAWRLTTEATS